MSWASFGWLLTITLVQSFAVILGMFPLHKAIVWIKATYGQGRKS